MTNDHVMFKEQTWQFNQQGSNRPIEQAESKAKIMLLTRKHITDKPTSGCLAQDRWYKKKLGGTDDI